MLISIMEDGRTGIMTAVTEQDMERCVSRRSDSGNYSLPVTVRGSRSGEVGGGIVTWQSFTMYVDW